MNVTDFMKHHYRHFNAATVVAAAEAYERHLAGGGKMLMTLAGAMSTAELGLSLAEMIRQDKVHAISCTGANLEEDIFNLVAHDHYLRLPHYRELKPEEENDLMERGYNRVTDTCIPEAEALRRIDRAIRELWKQADVDGQRYFPHEYFYRLIKGDLLKSFYQIDPRDSWVCAAAEKNLPIFTPGWEDSSLGNVFSSHVIAGRISNPHVVKSGIETMLELARWYESLSATTPLGFFQIGGGIAGDFSICVVPMLRQDLERDVRLWSYFCQISDSTTSYGSYSGAVPNEKITWEKLAVDTPRFIIESDATIVAPLMFAHLLGW